EAEGDAVDVGGHAAVDFDLEFSGVGVEQRDGAGSGVEVIAANGEDGLHGLLGVAGAAGERADAVEGGGDAGVGGLRGHGGAMVGATRLGNHQALIPPFRLRSRANPWTSRSGPRALRLRAPAAQ